jgi:hypothetical protein
MITEHELYDVVEFEIVGEYTLWLKFDDGFERTINFKSVLHGEVFEPLQDLNLFNQVMLSNCPEITCWSRGFSRTRTG